MRTLIAVPCMDQVQTDFFRSCVGLEISGEVQWTTCQSSLVYDARNKLAEIAIADGFDRVLWIDSDMVFEPTLFRRLSERLDQGAEIISALAFGRKQPIHPCVYQRCEAEIREDGLHPVLEPYDDYLQDALFEVAACGFGCVMTTTDLLRRVKKRFPLPFFPEYGFGEDLIFCLRARSLGTTILCDSGIKVGHAGSAVFTEETYRRSRGLED